MRGKKILIIDDDDRIRDIIAVALSKARVGVASAADGPEGLRQLESYQPDLIILDIMMPEMDGWQTYERIRQVSAVPVMFLSALDHDRDIIRGLDSDAVDYITKPFSPSVLVARVQRALHLTTKVGVQKNPAKYADQDLVIDLCERRVLVQGRAMRLTKTEYRLLRCLVENAGQLVTTQRILENVWGNVYQDEADYVHVYISRLRHKLERDPKSPEYLLTEYGQGYRFKGKSSGSMVTHQQNSDQPIFFVD